MQLVHIAISPHNAAFYKLLDELWSEAEDLMDRGISGSGQGFDAPSAGRLGSHAFIPIHNPPEHKMADAIRKVRCCQQSQLVQLPGQHSYTASGWQCVAGANNILRQQGGMHRQLIRAVQYSCTVRWWLYVGSTHSWGSPGSCGSSILKLGNHPAAASDATFLLPLAHVVSDIAVVPMIACCCCLMLPTTTGCRGPRQAAVSHALRATQAGFSTKQ